MRHGKKFNHLGRKKGHRESMLSNMACSLIEHKRINTTIAKAKALKLYVEPLITKSKEDTTHSRRTTFRYLRSKDAVSELFKEIAPKVGSRPGGYTRIIRIGNRLGDNAEMCMIELVDFNELLLNTDGGAGAAKKTTRRSRGSASKAVEEVSDKAVTEGEPKAETAIKSAPKTEEKETPAATKAEKTEDKSEAEIDTKKDEAPKAESKKDEEKSDDAEENK